MWPLRVALSNLGDILANANDSRHLAVSIAAMPLRVVPLVSVEHLAVSIATLLLTVVPLVSVELVTDAAQELVVPLRVVLLVSEWPR